MDHTSYLSCFNTFLLTLLTTSYLCAMDPVYVQSNVLKMLGCVSDVWEV